MAQLKSFFQKQPILLSILTAISLYIFVHAYFFGYFISWDSTHYLRAAQSIVNGGGMFTHPSWSHFYGEGYFAIWPIGYPLLIALVSFLTRTEVYLASVILAVLLVWAIGLLFAKYFGQKAWLYSLVMLNVGFLRIFYFTWSETVYIFALILLSFTVANILLSKAVGKRNFVLLTFSAILLFLSRYVGAFSIGVIGLLWLFYGYLSLKTKDRVAKGKLLFSTISGIFSACFMLGYLLLNRHMTGFITGSPNHPRDPFGETLLNLYEASLIEVEYVFAHFFNISPLGLSLPILILAFSFVCYALFRHRQQIKAYHPDIIVPLAFLAIGSISWLSIVAMRFLSRFDPFNFRLLGPSTIVLCIGILGLLLFSFYQKFPHKKDKTPSPLKKAVLTVFFALFLFSSLIPTLTQESPSGYPQMREEVLHLHAHIPDGAAVVWGNPYLLFLRDDLAFTFDLPMRLPANMGVEGFFHYHENFSAIFLCLRGMRNHLDNTFPHNEEMQAFFRQFWYREEAFIEIYPS